jgi:hypothetical protein
MTARKAWRIVTARGVTEVDLLLWSQGMVRNPHGAWLATVDLADGTMVRVWASYVDALG